MLVPATTEGENAHATENRTNILDENNDQSLLRPSHSDSFHILDTMLGTPIWYFAARCGTGVALSRADFGIRDVRMLVEGNIIIVINRQAAEDHPGPANERANTHSCYTPHMGQDHLGITSIKSIWIVGGPRGSFPL